MIIPSLSKIRLTRLKPAVRRRPFRALQSLMTIAIHGIGPIHHFLAQEIQLPDADAAMMPTPTREPMSRPQVPGAEGESGHDGQGHGGVVERLRRNGVFGREAEDDGDEGDPEAGGDGEGFGGGAQGERAAFEVARVGEGHGDGDPVGEV